MKILCMLAILLSAVCCAFNYGVSKVQRKLVSFVLIDTAVLPESYTKRNFLGDMSVMAFDGAAVPGNFVSFDTATSTYEIRTLKAIVKGNMPATAQKPDNGIDFSVSIKAGSSLNGSSLIDGLTAEKGRVIDLEIKDEMIYSVPIGQIDTAGIINAVQPVPPAERKRLFYITSATVSTMYYNIHAAETAVSKLNKKIDKANTSADTIKNGFYMKTNAKGKAPISSSDNRLKYEKIVSIQIVPVNDFLNAAAKY